MRLFAYIFTFFMSLCLAAPMAAAQEITVNRVVAVVNGEPITLHELEIHSLPAFARARINPNDPANKAQVDEILRQTLEEAIIDKLIAHEAERYGMTVTEEEIDAEIENIMQRNNVKSPVEFERALTVQGLDMDSFRTRMRNNLINSRLTNQMVSRQILVSNADIEKYYNENKEDYVDCSVDMQILVFPPNMPPADVASLTKAIRDGKISFAEAVQKISIGPATNDGGKVSNASWMTMSPEVQEALLNTPLNELSGVIDAGGQSLLLIPLRLGEPVQRTLEEMRPEIEAALKAPLAEARFNEYVEQLRIKAVIDVRL